MGINHRLYFGDSAGSCLVRYDNDSGKGDHKHIGEKEMAYEFVGRDKLIDDFYHDVIRCLKNKEA
jgi:hypothetical protein